MFQGASAISLDAKGRLAIPTRYREEIQAQGGGRVVVTAHPHRCLLLYPHETWQPLARRVMAAAGMDPRASTIQQLLVGHADEVEMDSAGRILIAPTLRKLSGIERDVMMFGQGEFFKLWQPEAWDRQFAEFGQLDPATLPAAFEGLVF
ncbi:MAG: division/cell wall cluster transcriptional repressor MraZ [Pseudomonadota bacterium]|nr:division/cell wall cluster transcriptional repressor MraZ [Pseudomonadota bacterium]